MEEAEQSEQMIDYLSELNEAQRAAVLYDDGPALVVAGAGSGKTRVLTYKLAHLIEKGVPASRIMALTFTNKAAREMQERVVRSVGSTAARGIPMGTFHSVFARVMRHFASYLGYTSQFSIYDTADSRSLIKKLVKEVGLDASVYKPQMVFGAISRAKNQLISPEMYAADKVLRDYDSYLSIPRTYELYALYAARCKADNAMDFDDLLYQFNVLLRDFPEVCEALCRQIDWLLIDEFQDTNPAQYLLVRKLAEDKQQLFAVGDDAQSIYSFRGADVQNILGFTRIFPRAKVFKLEDNYRSTEHIVEQSNRLISFNRQRIPKELRSRRGRGEKIALSEYTSGLDEAVSVVDLIEKRLLADQTLQHKDIAILYRTNAQSRLFEEQLRRRGIPYRIYGGQAFYSRAEIKNVLAYFTLIVNADNNEAFERALRYPKKGIGDKSIATLMKLSRDRASSLYATSLAVLSDAESVELGKALKKKIGTFLELIANLRKAPEGGFLMWAQHILQESGIKDDLSKDATVEGLTRMENIEEFLSGVREFEADYLETALAEGRKVTSEEMLNAFLQGVALVTDMDTDRGKRTDTDEDRVNLMTVHAAKGLEFKEVYITGLEEGLFPSQKSVERSDVEEERRLFYVALTRAMNRCTLSLARIRMINGNTEFRMPSLFLKELDREQMDLYTYTADWEIETMPLPPSTETPKQAEPTPLRQAATRTPKAAHMPRPLQDTLEPGARVEHSIFGIGDVLAVEGTSGDRRAVIRFPGVGDKTILLRFARLKVL